MRYNDSITENFSQVINDIKQIIDTGKNAAYAAVDATMIARTGILAGVLWKKSNTGRNAPNTARN